MTQQTQIQWSDDYLLKIWSPKVFSRHDNFEDYLFSQGVISGQGIIRKPEEYRELIRKWNALGYARYRQDKANGFPARNKWLDILKSQFQKLSDKMDMKKVLEPTTSLITEKDLKEAGEIKPTYTPEEEAQNKIDVAKIPF